MNMYVCDVTCFWNFEKALNVVITTNQNRDFKAQQSFPNVRVCVEKALLVTQGAQSSGSDASDFTGDEDAVFLRLPPGRSYVSRHRYSEFTPRGDPDTERDLQSLDSRRRSSVFRPDMSASTLNGCRRQVSASRVFCCALPSDASARWASSSGGLQPASVNVPRDVMTSVIGSLRQGRWDSRSL